MKEQKLLIVESAYDVNHWLDKGWEVVSVTAQRVSAGSSSYMRGGFAVVIQKQKES